MKSQAKTKINPNDSKPYNGGQLSQTEWGTFKADIYVKEGGKTKRKRKQFDELDKAKEFIDDLHAERDRLGQLSEKLSHGQIGDAGDALHELKSKDLDGITLLQAAQFYVKHHKPDSNGWTVKETFNAYIESLTNPLEGSPARPRTLADKKNRLATFIEIWGKEQVERITETDANDWLESTRAEGRNLRNYKTQIQSLFNFAEREAPGNYRNTIAKYPQRKKKEVDPAETVTAKQAKAVLLQLEAIDSQSAVTLALGLFAGLRSSEICEKAGLQWEDVDLTEGRILVPASQAKTRDAREIVISDNLKEWLLKYHKESGRIAWSFTNYSKHRSKACENAKVDWPSNGARHSFATYHASLHGMRDTADQLGHKGGIDMLMKHYRGKTVRKADAQSYFKIKPKDGAKVIQLNGTG